MCRTLQRGSLPVGASAAQIRDSSETLKAKTLCAGENDLKGKAKAVDAALAAVFDHLHARVQADLEDVLTSFDLMASIVGCKGEAHDLGLQACSAPLLLYLHAGGFSYKQPCVAAV